MPLDRFEYCCSPHSKLEELAKHTMQTLMRRAILLCTSTHRIPALLCPSCNSSNQLECSNQLETAAVQFVFMPTPYMRKRLMIWIRSSIWCKRAITLQLCTRGSIDVLKVEDLQMGGGSGEVITEKVPLRSRAY